MHPSNYIALVASLGALMLAAWPYLNNASSAPTEATSPATFDTISAQRINIVDPDGTLRMAIANRAYPPDVIYRGETYSNRSIDDIAGVIFYESDGDETGGIAMAQLRDNNQRALIFDYTHQLTDGVGMVMRESLDGEDWKSGFFISDRRPYEEGRLTSSQGVERIWLSNETRDAALIISDPEGRPRIRIGVDAAGDPAIQVFDETGVPVFDAINPVGAEQVE